jgi:hypothetical protein
MGPAISVVMRMRYLKELTAFISITLGLSLLAQARPVSNPIAEIQSILRVEEQARVKFTNELNEAMDRMHAVNATRSDRGRIDTALTRHESRVIEIRNKLTENQLRIEFLNDLMSVMDRRKAALKELPGILLELSKKQILATAESPNAESKLWLFELYLSIALRDIMEPSENLGEFIKKYLVYSTIADPRSPQDFLKSRNYIGGNITDRPKLEQDLEKEPETETESGPEDD